MADGVALTMDTRRPCLRPLQNYEARLRQILNQAPSQLAGIDPGSRVLGREDGFNQHEPAGETDDG
jgi:hypothetical protein